jgi:hypothetical protein
MKCEALVMETLHLVITFQNSNNTFPATTTFDYSPTLHIFLSQPSYHTPATHAPDSHPSD